MTLGLSMVSSSLPLGITQLPACGRNELLAAQQDAWWAFADVRPAPVELPWAATAAGPGGKTMPMVVLARARARPSIADSAHDAASGSSAARGGGWQVAPVVLPSLRVGAAAPLQVRQFSSHP